MGELNMLHYEESEQPVFEEGVVKLVDSKDYLQEIKCMISQSGTSGDCVRVSFTGGTI